MSSPHRFDEDDEQFTSRFLRAHKEGTWIALLLAKQGDPAVNCWVQVLGHLPATEVEAPGYLVQDLGTDGTPYEVRADEVHPLDTLKGRWVRTLYAYDERGYPIESTQTIQEVVPTDDPVHPYSLWTGLRTISLDSIVRISEPRSP